MDVSKNILWDIVYKGQYIMCTSNDTGAYIIINIAVIN